MFRHPTGSRHRLEPKPAPAQVKKIQIKAAA
jgi:hypothetical protein